jgi:acetyl-CoA carboxylase carboxyltransferase component
LLTAIEPIDQRPIAADARAGIAAGVRLIDDHEVGCFVVGEIPELRAFEAEDAAVVARVIDDARACGLPIVGVVHGATVDATCGISGLDGWGRVARAIAAASGVVPTILVIDGPMVTGLALVAGLFDVVVVTDQAVAYVSSPASVAATTGRLIDAVDLGGAATHANRSGAADIRVRNLHAALEAVASVLAHLPANNAEPPPVAYTDDPLDRASPLLDSIVPDDVRVGYDVRFVIEEIADDAGFVELGAGFGQAMVCGLAGLGGHPIGVVANQPAHLAGAIDIESSQKAARFVQWCDAFGIPLLTIVDTPGYLPGRDLEWAGMIRHGGQLAFAYAAATVPRLCVILRKAYGGAYIVMDCKTMGNDLCVAWPRAEIAVMGAAGAVQILHARALAGLPIDEHGEERARLEAEYERTHLNPDEATRRGFVDAVIEPSRTREVLCRGLPSLLGKRSEPVARKHHNGPC